MTLLVVLVGALWARRVVEGASQPRTGAATVVAVLGSDSITRYLEPVTAPVPPARIQAAAASLGRDPFHATDLPAAAPSPVAAAADAPVAAVAPRGWELTAILITDARRAAVIDDDIVSVGDPLAGGARVTAVEPDHVVITTARGERRMLTVASSGGA